MADLTEFEIKCMEKNTMSHNSNMKGKINEPKSAKA